MERVSDNDRKKWMNTRGNTNVASRNHDLPAIIYFEGDRFWIQKGNWHREKNLPSVIHPSGRRYWYKDGKNVQEKEYPSER